MSVYEKIEHKVVDMLANGIVPWHRPFDEDMLPRSHRTGEVYVGINRLLLSKGGEYWTFNQVKDAGLRVKKGCHAETIYFYSRIGDDFYYADYDDDGNICTKQQNSRFLLKGYNVFHEDDVVGLQSKSQNIDYDKNNVVLHEPQKIVNSYLSREDAPKLVIMDGVPCYAHGESLLGSVDEIRMPAKYRFDSIESYYGTLFHEMVHSTGHKSRLDRKLGSGKASFTYAREEFVAEMGSAALCSISGLSESLLDNSAAYCASWMDKIRSDIRAFVWAANKADVAVNYILTGSKTVR